jgi:hypothetical protein
MSLPYIKTEEQMKQFPFVQHDKGLRVYDVKGTKRGYSLVHMNQSEKAVLIATRIPYYLQ